MSKIIFIEPKAPNLHIYSQFVIPRLGSYILGALMRQIGWDVDIIFEEIQRINFDRIGEADLVGISTITSTAPRAYVIADRIRDMGIPVILGGPHVTFLKEEALEHADFVIRGEGERPLMAFIEAWEKGEELSSVPNLSYRKNGEAVHNQMDKFVNDLDEIPFPDLSDLLNEKRQIAGYTTIPVQTSRGCPYDCSFCSVTGMFGRQYRFRSTQNIIEELRRYNDRTPLPGSKIFNKLISEKRIVFDDWALYDAHHVVFRPAKLSLSKLQKAQIFSHKKFYSWIEMVKKLFRFRWFDLGLAHYARNLNKAWLRKNRTFLKVLELLAPKKYEKILVDYRQNIFIDR
ncbi:MAG: cobalamin-dependent protein [Candidatus Aminicenantaceae bacterium]|jgi:hypothetical protein